LIVAVTGPVAVRGEKTLMPSWPGTTAAATVFLVGIQDLAYLTAQNLSKSASGRCTDSPSRPDQRRKNQIIA
jgi:hypothetical protein